MVLGVLLCLSEPYTPITVCAYSIHDPGLWLMARTFQMLGVDLQLSRL